MGNTLKTGYLQNLIQYDGSGNIVLPGTLTISTNKLVATQEYVGTQVAALVNSAPTTLDTLNELAAALANDPNFATTITNSIAAKAPLNSPTFTGTVTLPNGTVTNAMLASGAVNASKIESLSITNTQISATAAIDQSKISGLVTDLSAKAPINNPTFTGVLS